MTDPTLYDVIQTTTGEYHAYLDHIVAGRGPTADAAEADATEARCDFCPQAAARAYEEFLVCRGHWHAMRANDRKAVR